MDFYKCENCNQKLSDIYSQNLVNNNYYFYCKKCLKMLKVCSKSQAKKLFLFNDNDLKNLKIIYLNNNHQFFLYDDVKNIILNKYENFDNLQKIINDKINDKKNKLLKNNNVKIEREKKLKEAFILNKLEYKNYGDCYSFINYGDPDLETVIKNEVHKIKKKNIRRMELANELKKLNINLDESLKSCYEFINNIGYKSLQEIVRNIEVEYFLKYNTNYVKLCEIYNTDQAKDIAISEYLKSEKKIPNNIDNKIISTHLAFE